MTGYGSASAESDGVQFTLELRSLNNRYLKVSSRLPDEIAGLEAPLETQIRQAVGRGTFSLNLKIKVADAAATSDINDQALLTYLDHLETVRNKVGDESVQIDLTQLLALPGVLQPSNDADALLAKARATAPRLLDEALARLIDMRTTEGQALAADLLHQQEQLRVQVGLIRDRAPVVLDEYHQKLTLRVGELTARAKLKVDESDLIREVAIFADRSDISEEISRLTGHLDQFCHIIRETPAASGPAAAEPAGRTLDFIAQEMLREANTIGSKSNDAAISRAVVEMKSRIDRIKEQVQNVE